MAERESEMMSSLNHFRASDGRKFRCAKFYSPEFIREAAARARTIKNPALSCGIFVLNTLFWRSPTLPYTSTIGSGGLNCRVRNENGCGPTDKPPEQNIQSLERFNVF
jgi:hypothetical protein